MVMRVLVLTLIVAALVLAISTLAKGSPPGDPFAPYAQLLSRRQALKTITDQNLPFMCTFVLSEASQNCSLQPKDGVFSDVVVWLPDGVPAKTAFEIIEGALRVGDLVTLWGQPESVVGIILFWPEKDGVIMSALTAPSDWIDHFAPVWMVSFTFKEPLKTGDNLTTNGAAEWQPESR